MNASTTSRHITRQRASWMLYSLLFATGACVAMVLIRFGYSGKLKFGFLLWNLILAWIPLLFALAAYRLHLRGLSHWLPITACALVWFVFFPNAPYIVTDFVHLHHTPLAPLWYDLLVIMAFAWTGLFLGYLSLYLMQEIARRRFGARASWGFVLVTLALSSFGVYLGRFQRWNSWDLLRDPTGLLSDTVRSIDPFSRPTALVFSGAIFLFLLLSYCALFCLTHLHGPDMEPSPTGN